MYNSPFPNDTGVNHDEAFASVASYLCGLPRQFREQIFALRRVEVTQNVFFRRIRELFSVRVSDLQVTDPLHTATFDFIRFCSLQRPQHKVRFHLPSSLKNSQIHSAFLMHNYCPVCQVLVNTDHHHCCGPCGTRPCYFPRSWLPGAGSSCSM